MEERLVSRLVDGFGLKRCNSIISAYALICSARECCQQFLLVMGFLSLDCCQQNGARSCRR
jgi:hypothetical protein